MEMLLGLWGPEDRGEVQKGTGEPWKSNFGINNMRL